MSPEQIEKEMAFFDEHAWLDDKEFSAAVNAHIENQTKTGVLKTNKGKNDVDINEFINAYRDRENVYTAQNVIDIEELLREEIIDNPAYRSVFNNMMSMGDLFNLLKKSVKEGDQAATVVTSLNADELNMLSIGDYSKVKSLLESRLLPLAKYLDTVPEEQLTNVIRNKCLEKAMKGALEVVSPETLVKNELADASNKMEIRRNRSYILMMREGKEMGEVEVDKTRMVASSSKKEDVLLTRQKRIATAANFWKTVWNENPKIATVLTKALGNLKTNMVSLYERKEKEFIIDRKEEYTKAKFHEDYTAELKRFVKKIADKDENIFTNSEMCVQWYKSLPMTAEHYKKINAKEPGTDHKSQKTLDEAVKPFLSMVRAIVTKYNINVDDLADACNEFALMGNADILLGVGQKYENTLYKPEDEYIADIHDISNRMSRNDYITNLILIRDDTVSVQYNDIIRCRELLLASKNNETLGKRRTLFNNINHVALALIDAAKSMEPGLSYVDKMEGKDVDKKLKEYREAYDSLKKKRDAFEIALDKFEKDAGSTVTYGDESTSAEEALLSRYNELFAEMEKCSDDLYDKYEKYSKKNKDKGYNADLGNTGFILGVREVVKNHKEFVSGEDSIKNIYREIIADRENNYQKYGAKNASEAFAEYLRLSSLQKQAIKENDIGLQRIVDEKLLPVKNYNANCDRIRANDKKVGDKDKMAIFLPVLFQDDRFIELMTKSGKENDKAIDEYLAQYREKVSIFLEAIAGKGNKYVFDMTTVVPQFIEHHKDELLNGSEVFTTVKDYEDELKFISNAWQTRKSKGKSADDVIKAKANSKVPITEEDKNKIVKAIMREGVVSYEKLTDPEQLEGILVEYKRRWDNNLEVLKKMPVYKKLMKKKLNGAVDKNLADLLRETYSDKLITMSELDMINSLSSYAQNIIDINKTRSIVVESNDNQDWDYVKERKVKEEVNKHLSDGRNALAKGNADIRKAADSYYNGVSILSNAKTNKDKQKLISADTMEKNREKVRLKIEAIKAKKNERVHISKEDLDIMTELYSTGNVWDSFPLLWESNIEEAFDSLVKLRKSVREEVEKNRAQLKGNTGLTDELRDHDINRFILYMAAHGRLHYEGGSNGFIVKTSLDFVHWFKTKFNIGTQDIKQDYEESNLGLSEMYNAYGQIQSQVDKFSAEGLNLKASQYVIDQCNSERMALQMAMFTMDEAKYIDLLEERKSLIRTSDEIAEAVEVAIKNNIQLKQDKGEEINRIIDVLTRGFIDYYGEEIKRLVPVRKDEKKKEVVLRKEDIDAARERIIKDIVEKLSGKNTIYYINAFMDAEAKISEEELNSKKKANVRTTVSINEFNEAIKELGSKREKIFAQMSEGEKKAFALIVSSPYRFLATDRVGAINMIMNHDKVTDAYFHKMYNVEENRANASAIDIVTLLSNKQLDKEIDYMGAYERLIGRVGTKGGKAIFDQAVELIELCKERVNFYKTREWDNIADPEKSIKLAGLLGASKSDSPKARELKNSKGISGMKAALSEALSASTKKKFDSFSEAKMGILIALLQNRSILDESTVKGKEGMSVNTLMREQVVRDLCMSATKRAQYQENAAKQMYIKNAIMTLLSYQVRDDVKLENGILKAQDLAEGALERKTIVDEKLLLKAMAMADEIDKLTASKSVENGNMRLEEFNDSYNSNIVLSRKRREIKYSSDLDGILFNVNTILKSFAAGKEEFSVFKNKAGDKAMSFRKSLCEKWKEEYEKRLKDVEKLDAADKIAFDKAKEEIDKMVLSINENDSQIKTNKITA